METHPSNRTVQFRLSSFFFVVVAVEEIESRHSIVTTYSIYSK